MISRKFAQTVVEHWLETRIPYETKKYYYFCRYDRVNGWIEVRKVSPAESLDYAELVAVYRMAKGWIICG